MSSEKQALRMAVLLFTDIVDSVGLERRLGTEAYSRLLKLHHELFRQTLAETGSGTIHLDTGDGFLSEFTTAAEAVNTALLFQMLLRETDWDGEAPKVRIGIHQGQLAEIRFDTGAPGKIVGLPVSIASRVMNLAQPGQILLTRPVYEDARQFIREHPVPRQFSRAAPPLRWQAHGSYVFRGTEGTNEVFEVGAAGLAPLTAPLDSEKARRAGTPAPRPPLLPGRYRPAIAAGLTIVCGLGLWASPSGEKWANASYDALFRFGNRAPTNKVALVLLDNSACEALGQTRENWDRALHAELLNKLAEAKCPLVVFDILFKSPRNPQTDLALATAMRRHGHVVLMTKVTDPRHPVSDAAQVSLPDKLFLAAATNHGIGQASDDPIVRQHWPFPAPADEPFQSLPWVAARLSGANLNEKPQEQWLRYYGERGAWQAFSYHFALSNTAYFHDKIVWIGNKPESLDPSHPEHDKFQTPYTRWTGEAVGGIEILATTFLNLMNGDWLRRPSWAVEVALLILSGVALGGGLCRFGRLPAVGLALAASIVLALTAVLLSYYTNFWFPWLIIVGGQVPCALACAVLAPAQVRPAMKTQPFQGGTEVMAPPVTGKPEVPNYELFGPPVGAGGFGEVWIARSLIGQWQAVKVIYRATFGDNPGPYEAEFNGLKKYKPVSEKHPGLLRIELIGEARDRAHFYYVMELGDALNPGWEKNPSTYKPRDLETLRKQAPDRRLPVPDCLRIGATLAEALEFLHGQGLTHRDIKPSNVIFVNGHPKLADVGLVTDIRAPKSIKTWVGTAGYMPPPPERPGTAQADIFALGMVLYVVSTGRDPDVFPGLATTLMENSHHADFMRLNAIILKACQPDCAQRYQNTAEMVRALRDAQHHLRGPIHLPKI